MCKIRISEEKKLKQESPNDPIHSKIGVQLCYSKYHIGSSCSKTDACGICKPPNRRPNENIRLCSKCHLNFKNITLMWTAALLK